MRPSDLSSHGIVYLATPYSKYSEGIDKAFEEASRIAGLLMKEGVKVYSPIAHTHPLAKYAKLDPMDHKIWLRFDEALMSVATTILVAKMAGWDESFGVAYEIGHFTVRGKQVFYLEVDTWEITVSPSASSRSNTTFTIADTMLRTGAA